MSALSLFWWVCHLQCTKDVPGLIFSLMISPLPSLLFLFLSLSSLLGSPSSLSFFLLPSSLSVASSLPLLRHVSHDWPLLSFCSLPFPPPFHSFTLLFPTYVSSFPVFSLVLPCTASSLLSSLCLLCHAVLSTFYRFISGRLKESPGE